MPDYNSAARRLSVYEEYVPVPVVPNKKKHTPVRLRVVSRSNVGTNLVTLKSFVTFVAIVACICFIFYNQVLINETNRKIYSTNKEIVQLESEYVKMKSSLETTMSIRNVTKHAEQELNMHRVSPTQVIDLRIYEDDKVEIAEKEKPEGFSEVVETTAASIMEYFKIFFSDTH